MRFRVIIVSVLLMSCMVNAQSIKDKADHFFATGNFSKSIETLPVFLNMWFLVLQEKYWSMLENTASTREHVKRAQENTETIHVEIIS